MINNQFQVHVPQTQQTSTGKNLLYVSDLPQNCTEEDLRFFFQEFNDNILIINITNSGRLDMINPKPPSATIVFRDYQVADNARKQLNLRKIKGKTVRIMWHERDNSIRYNSQTNIFVKNIPFNIKPREVYEYFLTFGDIVSTKVHEDEDGNHQGYGYINYYSPESAAKAIESSNGKEVWGGKLDVQIFQKKNERDNMISTTNNSIYIKNLPAAFSEEELSKLVKSFGEVTFVKLFNDQSDHNHGIATFTNEETANKAKNELNEKKIKDSQLHVESYVNKNERKRILNTKILESNNRLNSEYRYCNLHVKNIPYHAKEEDLASTFAKYGDIKSVKIEKYMLVTKEGDQLKELPTSKGFGYVCFENPEAAKAALDDMNGKFLPKYESWKRPLLIDFFMPKTERITMNKQLNQNSGFGQKMQIMGFNQPNLMQQPGYNSLGFNPNMMTKPGYGQPQMPSYMMHPQQQQQQQPGYYPPMVETGNVKSNVQQPKQQGFNKQDDVDYNYLKSLESDFDKKDYLGDLIFKKIENHKLSQVNNFTIDTIGKITGMILGIEDINEIVDICKNYSNLTNRIQEALELLKEQQRAI